MALRTVLVTPEWSLDRPGQRARVSCAIALVQDDDDRGFYELRIALNGEPFWLLVDLSAASWTATAVRPLSHRCAYGAR